jgi:transposase-like protein
MATPAEKNEPITRASPSVSTTLAARITGVGVMAPYSTVSGPRQQRSGIERRCRLLSAFGVYRHTDTLAAAVEEVRNGAKLKDVAHRLGLPPRTLCRWTIAAGVRRKNKTQGIFTPEEKASALAQVRDGVPYRIITQRLGISVPTLSRWASEAGLRRRVANCSDLQPRMDTNKESGVGVQGSGMAGRQCTATWPEFPAPAPPLPATLLPATLLTADC